MTKTRRFLVHGALLLAFAITARPTPSLAGKDALAVVVAKDFPVDNVTFGDLKRVYMGNPAVIGGTKLVPFTYPRESSERVAFDQSVLGMDPDEVGRYWIDRKIRGQSGPPKSVESAAVVMKILSKVDGSIGYVRRSATNQTVKILRIDGKLPGDAGYRVGN